MIYICTFTSINACYYLYLFLWSLLKYEFLEDSNKAMMREDQEIIFWEQSKDKSNVVKGEEKTLFFDHRLTFSSIIHWERNVMNYITLNFQWKEKKNFVHQKILASFFSWHLSCRKIYIQSLYSLCKNRWAK